MSIASNTGQEIVQNDGQIIEKDKVDEKMLDEGQNRQNPNTDQIDLTTNTEDYFIVTETKPEKLEGQPLDRQNQNQQQPDIKVTLKTANEIEEIKPLDLEFELDLNFPDSDQEQIQTLSFDRLT